ncbi:Virginiamycin B lyase [compost metagenome]
MRALTPLERVRSRQFLQLALCAGVLALSGCPKMPRITTTNPTASASPSSNPTVSPSPTSTPSPAASPSPKEDPTTFTMTVGEAPQAIALDAAGNGYVTLNDDIVRIDGAVGNLFTAKTTSLKNQGFTFGAPSGIVTIGSVTWFTDRTRQQVRKITDESTGSTQDFAFGEAPSRLVYEYPSNLWIADSGAARVGILEADGFSNPFGATLAGVPDDLVVDRTGTGWALVTSGDQVHLAKLSKTFDGTKLSGINVDSQVELTALGSGAGLALDDQNGIWITGVAKGGQGQLMKIGENGTPTADFNFQQVIPGRFAIRGGFAWIPDVSNDGTTIHKVSLATGQVLYSFPIGGKASEIFKDPNGDLWVPISNGNAVVKLDF